MDAANGFTDSPVKSQVPSLPLGAGLPLTAHMDREVRISRIWSDSTSISTGGGGIGPMTRAGSKDRQDFPPDTDVGVDCRFGGGGDASISQALLASCYQSDCCTRHPTVGTSLLADSSGRRLLLGRELYCSQPQTDRIPAISGLAGSYIVDKAVDYGNYIVVHLGFFYRSDGSCHFDFVRRSLFDFGQNLFIY